MEQSPRALRKDMVLSGAVRSGDRGIMGMLLQGAQGGDASKVAPVDKFSLVLVALFAFAFLDERPSLRGGSGS